MKALPSFVLAALAAAGLAGEDMPTKVERTYRRRGRGKSKGGRGGSGTLLKRRFIRKFPAGYATQQTPIEHMHSAARQRALAHELAMAS